MNTTSRVMLLATVAFLGAIQIRFCIATWEARNTFLFIPFGLKPCTNIIDLPSHSATDVLKRGDVLIAVNGRHYTGESVYRQELRRATRYLDRIGTLPDKEIAEALQRWPFRVTVQSGAAAPRTVDVYFAHCTCGSLSMRQVIWYCILPSTIALLAGLFVIASRPRSALAWLFLAATICLAQIQLVPEWSSEWSQVANPLEWKDWSRIPALAYQAFFTTSWPAWMVVFAVYYFCARANRLLVWSALAPVFVLAVAKVVVVVGCSEKFHAVAQLSKVLQSASTEVCVFSLACTAISTWSVGRIAAITSTVLTGTMAILLYWPPPIPSYDVVLSYANKTEALGPTRDIHVVGPTFTVTLMLMIIGSAWKRSRARTSVAAAAATLSLVLLLVPFLYEALSTRWPLWWTEYVPPAVLVCFYGGLIGTSGLVLQFANVAGAALPHQSQ